MDRTVVGWVEWICVKTDIPKKDVTKANKNKKDTTAFFIKDILAMMDFFCQYQKRDS